MERLTGSKYVVTTGGTRGIVRGVVDATLQEADRLADMERRHLHCHDKWPKNASLVGNFRIENFGNGDGAKVRTDLGEQGKEDRFPQIMSGDRVNFVGGVDFRRPGALRDAFERRVLEIRKEKGERIVQVVYGAGVAPMDDDENVDDVDAVNTRAAVELAEAVLESGLASDDANFLYISSLAADSNGRRVPGLSRYTESKWAGIQGVGKVWNAGADSRRKVSVLLPGVFDSDMADEIMMSEKAPLEFFGAPLASTDPDNPMMQAVANAILSGRMPDEMKFPRLSRWYVKLTSTERQETLLPLLIKVFARSVLSAKGQTLEEHDRRIAYHKEHKTYGDNFPYDDLVYKKLWSGGIGQNTESALKFLGVV